MSFLKALLLFKKFLAMDSIDEHIKATNLETNSRIVAF